MNELVLLESWYNTGSLRFADSAIYICIIGFYFCCVFKVSSSPNQISRTGCYGNKLFNWNIQGKHLLCCSESWSISFEWKMYWFVHSEIPNERHSLRVHVQAPDILPQCCPSSSDPASRIADVKSLLFISFLSFYNLFVSVRVKKKRDISACKTVLGRHVSSADHLMDGEADQSGSTIGEGNERGAIGGVGGKGARKPLKKPLWEPDTPPALSGMCLHHKHSNGLKMVKLQSSMCSLFWDQLRKDTTNPIVAQRC